MVALVQGRLTPRRNGWDFEGPAAAGVVVHSGSLVARDAAGNVTKGAVAATLRACGVSLGPVDNSGGAAGALNVAYAKGVFAFVNDPADPLAKADIENDCYITDDQTVCKTSGGATKSKAGKVVDIDAAGVWVKVG